MQTWIRKSKSSFFNLPIYWICFAISFAVCFPSLVVTYGQELSPPSPTTRTYTFSPPFTSRALVFFSLLLLFLSSSPLLLLLFLLLLLLRSWHCMIRTTMRERGEEEEDQRGKKLVFSQLFCGFSPYAAAEIQGGSEQKINIQYSGSFFFIYHFLGALKSPYNLLQFLFFSLSLPVTEACSSSFFHPPPHNQSSSPISACTSLYYTHHTKRERALFLM